MLSESVSAGDATSGPASATLECVKCLTLQEPPLKLSSELEASMSDPSSSGAE